MYVLRIHKCLTTPARSLVRNKSVTDVSDDILFKARLKLSVGNAFPMRKRN